MKNICLVLAGICFLLAVWAHTSAASVMHEIYGAEFGIMATIFLCTYFIVGALKKK